MNDLVQREERAISPADGQPITPMAMLQVAVQQGADLDRLEKLMELQQRWEANEARKAFVAALNAFKADPPRLTKNKHVVFVGQKGKTEYDHATLDHVSDEIGKALAKHGLSHRWDTEQLDGGAIRVTCILTHQGGHTERTALHSGADQSGGKNSIQAIGSTVTYLQRYTLLAATGMAVADMDNDGAGDPEPPAQTITKEQAMELVDMLEESGTPEPVLVRWAFAGKPPQGAKVEHIPAAMFERCKNKLRTTLQQREVSR